MAALLSTGAFVALLIESSSDTPSGVTTDERVVSFVGEQLRAQGGPTSAFAVVRDGEVAEFGSVGDDITSNTPFLLGSLSKSFTAMAVMQLVDDGQVRLDDPVVRHIPWFRTADPSRVITVQQLLNHTSGLPAWAGTVDLTEPGTTLEQRVRAVAEVELVSDPGSEFHYCNKNYAILGLLVETVTDVAFVDYLQQHILDPLGMQHTFTNVADAREGGLVDGSSIWFGAHVPQTPVAFPGALPDGYMVSTIADLAHYAQVQEDGTYAGRRIISEESLLLMHTGQSSDDAGSRYGFGWRDTQVDDQRVFHHEGDLSTFHSNLGMLPSSGTALVVLTAHNSQLFDTSAPYMGGMHILAGGSTPDIDHSFLATESFVVALAIAEILLLAAGTLGLIRRIRRSRLSPRSRLRMVGLPAMTYVTASIVGAAVVYLVLKTALQDELVVTPGLLFVAIPDLLTMVIVAIGWLALAGIATLIAGSARGDAKRT